MLNDSTRVKSDCAVVVDCPSVKHGGRETIFYLAVHFRIYGKVWPHLQFCPGRVLNPFPDNYRPSATEFLCLFVGGVLVIWYAWFLDDAFIYFRYIDNWLLNGVGLVYNVGEYVEGFSSPAWLLLVAAFRAVKLNYWLATQIIGLLAFVAFWYLAVLVNRRLSTDGEQPVVVLNIPLIYLAMNYGVLCYFTSGVESPLVIVAAAIYAAIYVLPTSVLLQILVGLAPMIRHELFLPFAIVCGWLYWKNGKLPVPALLSCVLTLGSYLVFRVWYYADLFPNTFYLKDDIWITQGFLYVYDTVIAYHVIAFVFGSVALFVALGRRFSPQQLFRNERLMMLLTALPVLLYVIKIGGDGRHFRYLAFPFCLMALASGGLAESAQRQFSISRRQVAAIATIFALVVVMSYPRELSQHPLIGGRAAVYHHRFLGIYDAAFHRWVSWTHPWWLEERHAELPFKSWRALSVGPAVERFSRVADEDEVLVEDWCKLSYLLASTPVVHIYGLTDPFLARTKMSSDRAGHKNGLKLLAFDIRNVRIGFGFTRGAFEHALSDGQDIPWVSDNLQSISMIEEKVYNRRDFFENLRLALTRVPQIIVPEVAE